MGSKRLDRRELLKSGAALAGGMTLGAVAPAMGQTQASEAGHAPASPPMIRGDEAKIIAYGDRSKHVTSVRIPHGGRPSPDNFGLTFHVASPLQDSVGVITPSSLHYFATTRGSFLPDIDPSTHSLMIHGMVDRPLTFTMADLKRLPSVTRLHFIECAGNRTSRRAKTVQESHGMTSCAEWTGVLLSTLLKECGLKGSASWFVAEGVEEVKGASSMPIAKAMDDCMIAYGMNGEAVRPQNGFPLRLMVPGFEGIFHTKWLRRIKVVDRYYMNYNDFGHLRSRPESRGAEVPDRAQVGDHVPFRQPAASRQRASTRSAAWPGPAAAPFARSRYRPTAARSGTTPSSRARRSAWRIPDSVISGTGTETRPSSCHAAPTRSARFNPRASRSPSSGTSPSTSPIARPAWTTPFSRGRWPATGA